jgi:putative flippase GtrA
MKQSIMQHESDESLGGLGIVGARDTRGHQSSYRPTPWLMMNNMLDVVDDLTNGRAGLVQRFFSFACIGGFAACINLIVFFVIDHYVHLPVNKMVHNAIAFLLASEISLIANFIPNDYFTFRQLAGNRSWLARCARFHITALSGTGLTYLIQFSFNFFFHVPSFFAQASALIMVLFYNFTFHHVFTYRHKKSVVTDALLVEHEAGLIKQVMADQLGLDVDTLNFASADTTSQHSSSVS